MSVIKYFVIVALPLSLFVDAGCSSQSGTCNADGQSCACTDAGNCDASLQCTEGGCAVGEDSGSSVDAHLDGSADVYLDPGTSFYLSPSGNDDHTAEQAQDEATPWRTFAHAFSTMKQGDELILLDGTYAIANGTGVIGDEGAGSAQPPSGLSKTDRTVIRAQHGGGAIIDGTGATGGYAVMLGTKSQIITHVRLQGIKALGGIYLYNADYCYVSECGVNGSLLIGSNDHGDSCDNNLIEDSWIWGENRRGLAVSYEGRYNIWRRVVVRGDGEVESPAIGFTTYSSIDTLFQNCIVIDRLVTESVRYGDFASAQHDTGYLNYPLEGAAWHGCMSINSQDTGFHLEADAVQKPSHYLQDCVSITKQDVVAGINLNGDTGTIIENFTIHNTGTYIMALTFNDGSQPNNIVRSGIVKGNASHYGINQGHDVSYIDMFGTWDVSPYNACTCSSGCLTTDPEHDGTPASLKYPVRVEQGSALSGSAFGGSNYGATIIKRIGVAGSFYGDPGYDTVTSEDLWPWPNEDRIKQEMSVDYGSSDEQRGFCAPGTQLNGTDDITLTSYVWEYFGNPIPPQIYGEP